MNQDTRKDRRVKIVSLNVRYKSATVDEFIENHAHDVSRGGIYIKTANPFPPGTLLKFEIRLASDQAVIAGVGRVVWKRDAGTSNGERPAGMGVKFIKIDEPSKTVIDRLVNTKPDAGKAFESEAEMPTAVLESPAAKIIPPTATTKLTPPVGTPGPLPARKATMMGLGIPTGSSPPPADTPSKPKIPAATPAPQAAAARPASTGGGMFPSSSSEPEMPPKQEQTVMKQAAELLEEALREAGGSMDEIGHNPLFSGSSPAAPAGKEGTPAAAPDRAATPAEVAEVKGPSPTEKKKSSMPPVEVKTPSVEVAGSAKAKDTDDAAKARAMVAGMAPAPKKSHSEPPRTTRESPSAKSVPMAGVAAAQPAAKKGGGGAFILLFVVVAAAAGAVVMYRDRLFGTDVAPTPTTSATATAPTATGTATASAAASSEVPSSSAAASGAAGATTAPSASAASSATAAMAPTAAPSNTATAKPTATAAATAAQTATAKPTATAPATAAATATAAPKPTATATATAAATEAPTAAPKPKPKPKAADDNPY
ncbi:MAG TPA: TIGR02266 family protein [Polyangiaceae bacterium]|jgi:uncharacterized protein (TIGR02266 family)